MASPRGSMRTRKLRGFTWLMLAIVAGVCSAGAAATLDQIKSAGELSCGIVTEEYDYDKDDTHGNLTALGTDTCKAVAAAVLGQNGKLLVSSFPDEHHGLEAVASGKIALLAGASPRASMGTRYSVGFGQPFFFDGQGFIVAKTAAINSTGDLVGKRICFIGNTEAETVLSATLRERAINFLPFPFEEQGEMEAALIAGHCAAMTADVSQLANARAAFHGRVNDFVILPEYITFDPVSPAFHRDDPQWEAIVNWTIYAIIQAEASGVLYIFSIQRPKQRHVGDGQMNLPLRRKVRRRPPSWPCILRPWSGPTSISGLSSSERAALPSPPRIGNAHLENELADVRRCLRPATARS